MSGKVSEWVSERNAASTSHSPTGSHTHSPGLDPQNYVPKTLRTQVQRHGRLPVAECLDIALKLTDALAHLHGHGLVHRDVKPSNIIFVRVSPSWRTSAWWRQWIPRCPAWAPRGFSRRNDPANLRPTSTRSARCSTKSARAATGTTSPNCPRCCGMIRSTGRWRS
ncbi:MAG: hypothetical protein EXS36_17670 [Pedosphaera sp.]|nr:hypothetical protein [Pedosphaera sp.]